jgi:NAD(P)-dependent dehydrogenase (short-subunit alcohol dehydrogenase family)
MKKIRPVALVTGAARGIGRSIAVELARAGYGIAGLDLAYDEKETTSGLPETGERIRELGLPFLPVQGDISRLEEHPRFLQEVVDSMGRIDMLVNNAGVAPEKRLDLLETTPESYDRVLSVNSRGPFFLSQKAARFMIHQKKLEPGPSPCIVFITSISAYVSSPSRGEYCVSKAALSQTARLFAHRLAEAGIRVFEVRPGVIQTDMTEAVREKYDALIGRDLIPQKRWGYPEDVGRAVAALTQGGFDYATGLIVEISGGMQIQRL